MNPAVKVSAPDYADTDRDWLSRIEHRLLGGGLLDAIDYSYTDAFGGIYDGTGRLRKETDSAGREHKFQYNFWHYELTREDHPDFTSYGYAQDGNGNRTRKTHGASDTFYGIDVHNKLLWTNTTNVAPTSGQAAPYRLYTYNANGEPTQIEHRDAVGSPVVTEDLKWDGMGKLREVLTNGVSVYEAIYDGGGNRVKSISPGVGFGMAPAQRPFS